MELCYSSTTLIVKEQENKIENNYDILYFFCRKLKKKKKKKLSFPFLFLLAGIIMDSATMTTQRQ